MKHYNLAERLGEIRELAKLSQATLAKRVGVSGSLVSLWESGTREPSEDQFVALSGALGVTLDYLLNAEFRPQFKFRAKSTLTVQVKAACRRAVLDASEQLHFVHVVLRESKRTPAPFTLRADFNQPQLPGIARRLRESLRLNERVTLEEFKQALAEWGVLVFEWALPMEISGISFRGPFTAIFVNSEHVVQRRLFTLAHEFAHVVFHLSDKEAQGLVSEISSNRDAKEKEANAFATEFLMPQAEVENLIQTFGPKLKEHGVLGLAAQRFNISVEAMFYRLAKMDFFRWEERSRYITPWQRNATLPTVRVKDLHRDVARDFLAAAVSLYENGKASAGKLEDWFFAPRSIVEDYLRRLGKAQETGIGADD